MKPPTSKMSDPAQAAQRIAERISQESKLPRLEPPTIVEVSSFRGTYAFDVAAALDEDCRLARLDEREDVLDAAMLEAEKRRIPLLTFPCPAQALALKSESVDAMLTLDTWSKISLPDIDQRFVEASRCLRRGGMLFVLNQERAPRGAEDDSVRGRLEQSLKKAGFEIASMDISDERDLLTARKKA